MNDPKSLLFIAHGFPPAAGGGIQRPTKFVKFLARRGWKITVLTTQADLYQKLFGLTDESMQEDIPDAVEVLRVPSIERREPRWYRLMLQLWLSAQLAPDLSQLWASRAYRALVRSGRTWPVIFATGNPYSSLLLARRIARHWGVPYVAELRDAWCVANDSFSKLRLALHRGLERQVIQDSAATVVVTEEMRRLYSGAYPDAAERISVIENGVDVEEPSRLEKPQFSREFFEVVYTGIMTPDRPLGPFFRAMKLASEIDSQFGSKARFVVAGRIGADANYVEQNRALARESGVAANVQELGYLPHADTVRLQRRAGALLAISAGRHNAAGKSYEYVAAGRPVLGLVHPGGEAERILRLAPVHAFPNPSDERAIADALLAFFKRWSAGEFDDLPLSTIPQEYTRSFQAAQLDAALESVLKGVRD